MTDSLKRQEYEFGRRIYRKLKRKNVGRWWQNNKKIVFGLWLIDSWPTESLRTKPKRAPIHTCSCPPRPPVEEKSSNFGQENIFLKESPAIAFYSWHAPSGDFRRLPVGFLFFFQHHFFFFFHFSFLFFKQLVFILPPFLDVCSSKINFSLSILYSCIFVCLLFAFYLIILFVKYLFYSYFLLFTCLFFNFFYLF